MPRTSSRCGARSTRTSSDDRCARSGRGLRPAPGAQPQLGAVQPLPAAAAGKVDLAARAGSATAHVAGPGKLELRAYAAEVEIVAAEGPRITVSLADKSMRVALSISGERVEAQFGGKRQLRQGKARIELPRGSSVDLSSVSGAVAISGVGGEVRVRGMSGRVDVS